MSSTWTQRWVEPTPNTPLAAFSCASRPSPRLWSEGLGDPNQPVVLLVMGAMNQSIVWPDTFCAEIASAGFCVVRYDHRDTGLSSAQPYAMQPYGLAELTADAQAVAKAWAASRPVHWIGISMGGVLAQMAALSQTSGTAPQSVASLTLMMSTPDLSVAARATTGASPCPASLPPPLPAYLDHLGKSAREAALTPDAAIDKMVEGWRVMNGAAPGFDEAQTRALVRRAINRAMSTTQQPFYAFNHAAATLSARDLSAELTRLRVPTLVIHGVADPLLPLAHGEALARLIPNAALMRVPDMGHRFDTHHVTKIAPRVIIHLQNALRAALFNLSPKETQP